MAARIADEPAGVLLDLASGTGDIPCRLRSRLGTTWGGWTVHVTDVSPQMLAIARTKMGVVGASVTFALKDACSIDMADASVDVVTMSFGLKITDRSHVMTEALRVLKPDGVFLCLEASRITIPGLHRLYLAYMDACMPLIGRLATGGDAGAYEYLLRGVHDFPDQAALTRELSDAGFDTVTHESLSLGIVAIHRAVKPGRA